MSWENNFEMLLRYVDCVARWSTPTMCLPRNPRCERFHGVPVSSQQILVCRLQPQWSTSAWRRGALAQEPAASSSLLPVHEDRLSVRRRRRRVAANAGDVWRQGRASKSGLVLVDCVSSKNCSDVTRLSHWIWITRVFHRWLVFSIRGKGKGGPYSEGA